MRQKAPAKIPGQNPLPTGKPYPGRAGKDMVLTMYQIDFNKPTHVHFIGIGGSNMSGLAELLADRGFTVIWFRSKQPVPTIPLPSSHTPRFPDATPSKICSLL